MTWVPARVMSVANGSTSQATTSAPGNAVAAASVNLPEPQPGSTTRTGLPWSVAHAVIASMIDAGV